MSQFKLHISCIKNLETLRQSDNPLSEKLILAVKRFIKFSAVDFGIIENGAYRTAQQQSELFNKNPHVTRCDGYNKKSKHQSGLAIDLIPWVDGKYSWDERHTTGLACSFITYCKIHDIDIVSGADWKNDGNLDELFYDPCHFEIRR